jgi:hypothetical protein
MSAQATVRTARVEPAWKPWLCAGTWVGAAFCLVTFLNQCYIGLRLAQGHPEMAPVAVWFGAFSVLVHVFLWCLYAAFLAMAIRSVTGAGAGAGAVLFRDVFHTVGLAQVALFVWALNSAVTLWQGGSRLVEPSQVLQMAESMANTRDLAYFAGVAIQAALLSAVFNLAPLVSVGITAAPVFVLAAAARVLGSISEFMGRLG